MIKTTKAMASTSTHFPIPLLMPLVLCLCCSASAPAPAPAPHTLGTGASLTVEDHERAFRQFGENAFTFSIWFTDAADKTAVWTASPGNLVNGRASKITFRRDGNLALLDANGTTVWETKTKGRDRDLTLSLLDTGNLVISADDPSSTTAPFPLWQSFDSPTDTLVPTQPLTKDTRLVAGAFNLYYDHTNNLLRLLYDGPVMSTNYWPNPDNNAYKNNRITYNSTRLGVLDDAGVFMSSDNLTVRASDLGRPGVKRRLTVGLDGNLRIYSLDASTGGWTVAWAAMGQPCSAHGLCGENALCEYVPRLQCSCPPGFEMVDRRDWGKGCRPLFTIPNCSKQEASSSSQQQQFKFVEMSHTDFYGFDLGYIQSVSFESCKKTCLDNCLCSAFSYRVDGRGLCYPKFRLFNGFRSASFFGNIYLKVPIDFNGSAPPVSVGLEACDPNVVVSAGSPEELFATARNDMKWSYFFVFAGILGALDLLFIVTGWWFLSSKHSIPRSLEAGYRMVAAGQFRRFTYRELKDATGNFKEELGRGGSGVVYRGVLDAGKKVVAVKRLTNKDMAQGDEEFWAEMTVIGRINHMNLARILGFCSEGKRSSKLLVYEFVENESLDKHLFVGTGTEVEDRPPLPWRERYRIALGTARGLAYLHHECLEWVIHCDVKPENILITREYDAKIADFGLAKLSTRRDGGGGASVQLSKMRGTTGYMAPEWALNLPISAKVDVYSYGVVLLEMVIGRRVSDQVTPEGEPLEMPRIVQALRRVVVDSGDVTPLVDARLMGQFNPRQALQMVRISLSCLEERSSNRPTMDDVAKALTAYDDEDEHPAYKS